MLVVGLRGGIGAGKTTVAGLLVELGVVVDDVDGIGRQVRDQDEVRDVLAAGFRAPVLAADGTGPSGIYHHERLRTLAAGSHPVINQEMTARLDNISSASPDAVTVPGLAVLEKSGLGQLPDGNGYSTVVVEAATDLRVERLAARSVSIDKARNRVARQASDEEHRAAADHVILNNSDLTALTTQVESLWAALTG